MKLSNNQRAMLEMLIRKSELAQAGVTAWILVEPCEYDHQAKTLGSLLRNGLIRAQEYGTEDVAEDMEPGDKFTWRGKSYWAAITAKGIKAVGPYPRTVDPKPGTAAHTARLMAQAERHLPEGDRTDWDAWKEDMKEGGRT